MNHNSCIWVPMKKAIKKSRKELEIEQRKLYIMSCAEELFADYGYENTSMVMIAERSEFAVGSVYNFFSSKNEIFNAIVLNKLNKVSEDIFKILKEKIPSDVKVKKIITNAFDFFVHNENFIKIYLYELTRLGWGLPSELGEDVRKKLFEIIEKIEDLFNQGQKEGAFRNDIEYQKITIIFFEILVSYLVCWVKGQKSIDFMTYSDEMYEILMNGIGVKNERT